MGQHGAHLGPVGPRWAPCWPHEPCYQGHFALTIDVNDTFRVHTNKDFVNVDWPHWSLRNKIQPNSNQYTDIFLSIKFIWKCFDKRETIFIHDNMCQTVLISFDKIKEMGLKNTAEIITPSYNHYTFSLKNSVFQYYFHDDIMIWKNFLHHWPFQRRNHWSPFDSPPKGPAMEFDFFFDDSLNKLLNKQSSCQWFEMPWSSCYFTVIQ